MISACIITLNEEKNAKEIVLDIKGFVDEIVVVDAFSSDNTADIVGKYGAVVFKNHFKDYGSQRNFAINKAKHEWIFMIDADERCSDNLKKNLKEIPFNKKHDGYSILWKNYCDSNLVEVPRKLCLFRRYGYYKDELHEKVEGLKNIVNLKDENSFLIHNKTKKEQVQRFVRYKEMILQNIARYEAEQNWDKLTYYKYSLTRQREK